MPDVARKKPDHGKLAAPTEHLKTACTQMSVAGSSRLNTADHLRLVEITFSILVSLEDSLKAEALAVKAAGLDDDVARMALSAEWMVENASKIIWTQFGRRFQVHLKVNNPLEPAYPRNPVAGALRKSLDASHWVPWTLKDARPGDQTEIIGHLTAWITQIRAFWLAQARRFPIAVGADGLNRNLLTRHHAARVADSFDDARKFLNVASDYLDDITEHLPAATAA